MSMPKVKIRNNELPALHAAFREILDNKELKPKLKPEPAKIIYCINKNISIVEKAIKSAGEKERDFRMAAVKKDETTGKILIENNKPVYIPEAIEGMQEDIKKLMEEEIELELHPLPNFDCVETILLYLSADQTCVFIDTMVPEDQQKA